MCVLVRKQSFQKKLRKMINHSSSRCPLSAKLDQHSNNRNACHTYLSCLFIYFREVELLTKLTKTKKNEHVSVQRRQCH